MHKKIITGAILALSSVALAPSVSFAHHGVNGQFDLSKKLEVTGTVTRIRLVNPHSYVYFDATNDEGKTEKWRCELRSGSLLKRKGWTAKLFAKGTKLTIDGSPARTEPTTCFTENIKFENGTVLNRYGEVEKDGTFTNPEAKEAPADAKGPAGAEGGKPPSRERPPKAEQATATTTETQSVAGTTMSISGNWAEPSNGGPPVAYGVGRRPEYQQTKAGIEAGKQFARKDNPRFQCKPTNIIMDYRFDQMINKVEQSDTNVKITYGFMDVVRDIHIDGEFPETIEPSLAGYSVGTWKDNKLHVLTKGFTTGFLEAPRGENDAAIMHSNQMEVAEIFYVDAAGELVHEYTITDPLYLSAPHSHLQKSAKTDDEFIPFACDDLTVEEGYEEK